MPAIEHTELVATRLSPALLATMKKVAASRKLSVAGYLRQLVLDDLRADALLRSIPYTLEDDE